jgi:isopenicillin-N N-acyltransferase-like protein
MEILSGLKVLTLEGSPLQRGQSYGRNLRPQILQGIERWKTNLKITGVDTESYPHQFIQQTGMLDAVKKWTPDLLEEVTGIAEGSGVDFETLFTWNCTDEDWWFRIFEMRLGMEKVISWGHCSALGCSRDGDLPSMVAQNLDLPNYYDGLQVLLHIKKPESPDTFVFTHAGIVGMAGMNQSLGVCVNTLIDLNHAKDGLSSNFLVRGILEQSTLDDAVDFLHRVKHASGQNYTIGDTDEVLDFECSGSKVTQFTPYEGSKRVYHTNHSIVNDDRRASIPENFEELNSLTHARFGFLESHLKDPSKPVTVETIQSILGSHEIPLCEHNTHKPRESYTMGSFIMIMSHNPEMRFALPPPCQQKYQNFKFS